MRRLIITTERPQADSSWCSKDLLQGLKHAL